MTKVVRQPRFQRHVLAAELDRRHSNVVMGIHQSGDHDVVCGSVYADAGMFFSQLRIGSYLFNSAVDLKDCTVVQNIDQVVIQSLQQYMPTTDQ